MAAVKDLSHAQILVAARALLNEGGLPGFSIRALAERLGVAGAALRWHIGSRDRLLVAVVDSVLAEIQLPDPEVVDWRDWLRLFAASLRSTLQASPKVAPVVRDLISCAPRSLDIMATCQHALRCAGYRDAELLQAYNAFMAYLIGFNFLELTQRAATTSIESDSDLPARLAATAAAHPSPYVHEMLALSENPVLVGRADQLVDASYSAGLEALIVGLPPPSETLSSGISRPSANAARYRESP